MFTDAHIHLPHTRYLLSEVMRWMKTRSKKIVNSQRNLGWLSDIVGEYKELRIIG